MIGSKLYPPEPVSAGIFLSYKCNCNCRHCLYACSPRWPNDWISEADTKVILTQLAERVRRKHPYQGQINLNYGLHFTGGEPFLKFDLLLRVTEIARSLGILGTFVETNCFWCRDDESTREKLLKLKAAGLAGMLISVNPFVVERVPFARIKRAAGIGAEIFPGNAIVYQRLFYDQFRSLGLEGTLPFEEYLQRGGYSLDYMELLPPGRVSYKLASRYRKHPLEHFFGESCTHELVRNWHIHIDNYGHYIPGYCGGISLGDARDLSAICSGVDLSERPVLKALLSDMEELFRLGEHYGYTKREGYISKCHLCLDIRRHLVKCGEFIELRPREFYERLED